MNCLRINMIRSVIVLVILAHSGGSTTVWAIEGLRDRLSKKYGSLHELSASIEQTTSNQFLIKPIQSKINLKYTPAIIRWQVIEPVPTTVEISNSGMRMISSHGDVKNLGGTPDAERRLKQVVTLIKSVIALDFSYLEKVYEISYGAYSFHARPKKDQESALGQLFNQLDFTFDKELKPQQLVMTGPAETMTLEFRTTTFSPKKP